MTQQQKTGDAAQRGDMAAVNEADLLAQQDAQQLGLADACIATTN